MGVTPSTVSKWCTNTSQPNLATILKIADLLEVDIRELFVREYKQYLLSKKTNRNIAIPKIERCIEKKVYEVKKLDSGYFEE